jgi:hypothetical protein
MEDYQIILYRNCEEKLDRAICTHDPDLRVLVGHSNMLQYLHERLLLEFNKKAHLDGTSSKRCTPCDVEGCEDPTSAVPRNFVAI